ncbi:MAG: histidine triad nucleotide-binding protein [bacterium JZ-2024 1]
MNSPEECIFCMIISGKVPADIVLRGERALVIRDISPQAPQHLLIIPRKHITSLGDLATAEQITLGEMMSLAHTVAESYGYTQRGYRLVFNEGEDAGRAVAHLHFHFLAGRPLAWPPG